MVNESDSNGRWAYSEDSAKVVKKPWGKEVWINYRESENVGDEEKLYVMKKLYMEKGTKTSFQYHTQKVETNFILKGTIEAYFENDTGSIEKKVVGAGAIWTIPNGRKHRMNCLTDVVFMEASTPEVDDVIRVGDEYGRGDGRIQSEHE
ncbi:cupin [Candidatus Pacearchaeota archaeon]|nr:cupin [Candidatus Pacearchaeota archaeon]